MALQEGRLDPQRGVVAVSQHSGVHGSRKADRRQHAGDDTDEASRSAAPIPLAQVIGLMAATLRARATGSSDWALSGRPTVPATPDSLPEGSQ